MCFDSVKRILFTSVGRRVELVQHFKNAANHCKCPVEIWGADVDIHAPALLFCDKTVVTPRISDTEYIPFLINLCRNNKIALLIPTIDTDLLILSEYRDVFKDLGTIVMISSYDKITLCRDKRLTSDYFKSLGLNTPATVDDINKYEDGYPAFIKPIDGSSSVGANIARSFSELGIYSKQLNQYIVQPYVKGIEYTVDVFCDFNGNPIYITPRIRVGVRSGEVLKTRIHHQDSIINEVFKLISDFKPCGAITIQLIRDEAHDVNHYIEINPRYGGGAPLSMKAGADSAVVLLKLLDGENQLYVSHAAEEDAFYSRFDQSIRTRQIFSKQKIEAVIFDLDDTLFNERDYVLSGYNIVAQLLPQVRNAAEKLWAAFQAGTKPIDYVLKQENIYSEHLRDECVKAYRNHIPDIKLNDDVIDLLTALRNKHIKIGIITDGRPEGQQAKLQALGLNNYVDDIIITDELGGPQFRKPNDISFRIMQLRLGVSFEHMVYVGDNIAKDFKAPKVLGMQWIHYQNINGLYSSNSISSEATVVRSISEIKELLVG